MLYLVLVAISLIASALLILGYFSSNMAYHSKWMYLTACDRNLKASALAWAECNVDGLKEKLSAESFNPDTSALGIPAGSVSISLSEIATGNTATGITIDTRCSKGKISLKKKTGFFITY